ncbi:carbohydrate ABC transporter permease [Clostridium grantii]|uniref:Putative aldouronate transport system permease protein n=1 Tax=Clostridium grantii DSM 8605 TaxID=1121316 RepID=A0A1M5U2C9_9CLOT|nr:carbohydrate ABC transporter permease [Clostridium grantii]SHH57114.1 putative aldouronate transport system permease protein [Clostridium grantii DSM 8605]
MVGKKSIGEKMFDTSNIILLSFLMIISVYPFLHVLFSSFSDPNRLMQHQGLLFGPLGFTLKGYKLVLQNPNIITGYANTIFYLVAGTLINLGMTILGAFVLSRKGVYFNKFFMIMIVITMFFSGGLIPYYLVVKNLGMVNTVWAMLIPGCISTWNLIIMRTSFMAIPKSLEEACRIDGGNDFVILYKIILPLSKPIIAVITLFYAVGHWNEWFNAMIFLRDRSLYPLQLVLREILINNDKATMTQISSVNPQEENMYRSLIQYTTIVVATVPILFVYPFLQKYFVKGIMIGSLKE